MTEDALCLLENTPAAALGSCRKKLPPDFDGDHRILYEEIFSVFREYDIRYFFYIGGNDSIRISIRSEAFPLCGAGRLQHAHYRRAENHRQRSYGDRPHTGFGSAAKYIATTMQEILRDTAVYTVKAVTIVEIMGRDAGWLTAAAALPSLYTDVAPDLVYLPEVPFDLRPLL